MAIFQ
jgi:hypothetical protein